MGEVKGVPTSGDASLLGLEAPFTKDGIGLREARSYVFQLEKMYFSRKRGETERRLVAVGILEYSELFNFSPEAESFLAQKMAILSAF